MTEPTVHIIDDDPAVRDSLSLLVRSAGLRVAAFATAKDFLEGYRQHQPGCLVLDMCLPGIGGLDLLERWSDTQPPLPVIVLTGHGDVPAAVQAMKEGAMDFIQKPFNGEKLLQRIQEAIEYDQLRRNDSSDYRALSARMARLTPRERQIMDLIVGGKTNKVIAIDLNISERTVEQHRARIMKKMQVKSLAELVHTAVVNPKARQRHTA